jgi:VWA domain-containing protein/aerotolerance regulator-like protein
VSLLVPLALLGLLFVPLILAFYMLRLRRTERAVSSTYLWQKLVRDVEANAPWQRLRRSLLLLLQLLLVIALAFVVARPFSEKRSTLARDVVLVIDASASMGASDVTPDRLSAAKRAALDALADLPAEGKVSVIAAGATARVVANEVTDRNRLVSLVEGIRGSSAPARMDDALKLAGALAARADGAQILVATDAAGVAPVTTVGAPVSVLSVGRDRHNQAIVALAVRAEASGIKRSVFVSVANLDAERVTRRLQVLADGAPFSARDLAMEPLRRMDVVIDELPAGARVVETRLSSADAAQPGASGPADQLALDDRAWAIVPSDRLQRILLVGPGNVYLQNALSLLPNVELYGVTPTQYPDTTGKELFDLVVFDGFLPAELPQKPMFAIAPPATSGLGEVDGKLESPPVGQPEPDEPLLRNVDLTRLHVASAQKLRLPDWARTVIPGPSGASLLYSGMRAGLPAAVLAFDLRQSDLPLQVAWPILAANLAGELLGLNAAATASVAPGSPVDLPLPASATGARVTRPDGTVLEIPAGARGAGSVTFVGTDMLGVYTVEPTVPAGAASPGTTASSSASPAATATGGTGTAQPSASVPPRRAGETAFAVNLFDPDESNIAPGNGDVLARLGTVGLPGDGEEGRAREEWWLPLALLILGLLIAEWLVYERDGARRLLQLARRPFRVVER